MIVDEDTYVATQGPIIFADMVANAGGERAFALDAEAALGRLQARADAFARVQWLAEKVGEQIEPMKADILLADLEWEYGAVPHPDDTLLQRQTRVATLAKLPRGASRPNIEGALGAMLGSDFVAYVTTSVSDMRVSANDAMSEISLPANRFVGNWASPKSPPGLFKLAGPLARSRDLVGNVEPHMARLLPVAGNTQLSNFQRIVFDVQNYARTEALRVASIVQTPKTNTAHPGEYLVEVAPHFPHDKGTFVQAGRVAVISSTKRHSYVVLTADAAGNAEKRSTVHSLMRRIARGVSTWSVVQENSPGSGDSGPFEIGSSVIGRVPLRRITF